MKTPVRRHSQDCEPTSPPHSYPVTQPSNWAFAFPWTLQGAAKGLSRFFADCLFVEPNDMLALLPPQPLFVWEVARSR